MSEIRPKARQSEIVVQEFGNEILIYDLKANKAFNLNETSAFVWQMSDGKKTISEIADKLTRRFNSNISVEFVSLAVEQLQRTNLLANEIQLNVLFDNVSRREIVKRIGLSTLVSLPLVSYIIAPNAALALSPSCAAPPLSNGCPCAANGNCSSNCCATTPTGNTCVATPGIEPPGSGCRGGCECASGSCPPAAPGNPRVCV